MKVLRFDSKSRIYSGLPSHPLLLSHVLIRAWVVHLDPYPIRESQLIAKTGKPVGKKPLGRSSCRWEDNIRMYLKEIDNYTRNCVDSAQDRNPCECGIEPPGSISHGVIQLLPYCTVSHSIVVKENTTIKWDDGEKKVIKINKF